MAEKAFYCDHCLYISHKKFNLKRHIIKHHILSSSNCNRDRRPTFQCDDCEYTSKKMYNFKRHVARHSVRVSTAPVATKVHFQCHHCYYETNLKSCLKSHILRNHLKDRLNQPRITCSSCGLKFFQRSQFRKHVARIHNVAIEEEIRTFTSENEFLKWKAGIEYNECTRYVRNCGIRTYAEGIRKLYFNCYRDGFFKPVMSRKKTLKKQGSNKIDSSCPAEMVYTENRKGEIVVYYASTHFGHDELTTQRSDRTKEEAYTSISKLVSPLHNYTAEEVRSDSNNVPVAHSPDQPTVSDNLEIQNKAETVLDYLASQHCYTEDTKSRISNMLDKILEIMRVESSRILQSDFSVHYEILTSDLIHQKIEQVKQSKLFENT